MSFGSSQSQAIKPRQAVDSTCPQPEKRLTIGEEKFKQLIREIRGKADRAKRACLSAVEQNEQVIAAKPGIAVRVAGSYWRENGLNGLADKTTVEAFYKITRCINGGLNGIKDRLAWWKKAKKVFG